MIKVFKTPMFWLQVAWYLIGWSVLFFSLWFVFIFKPVVSVETKFFVDRTGNTFTFINKSYKPFTANTLCGTPAQSLIVFEDPTLSAVSTVIDNATGYGSGNSDIKSWESTGKIPRTLPPKTQIRVYKKLVYPCLGLIKTVRTDYHTFVSN